MVQDKIKKHIRHILVGTISVVLIATMSVCAFANDTGTFMYGTNHTAGYSLSGTLTGPSIFASTNMISGSASDTLSVYLRGQYYDLLNNQYVPAAPSQGTAQGSSVTTIISKPSGVYYLWNVAISEHRAQDVMGNSNRAIAQIGFEWQ